MIMMLLGFVPAGWVGHHQTCPKHHGHAIYNPESRPITFRANLRNGWRGDDMRRKGIQRGGIIMRLYLGSVTRSWILAWDPGAGGGGSTRVYES